MTSCLLVVSSIVALFLCPALCICLCDSSCCQAVRWSIKLFTNVILVQHGYYDTPFKKQCMPSEQQKRACTCSSTTSTLHCCISPRAVNHCNSSVTYSQAPKHRRKAPPRTLLHSCLALLSCALQSFQALKAAASPLFLNLLAMALQALLRWWNCSQDSQAVATA